LGPFSGTARAGRRPQRGLIQSLSNRCGMNYQGVRAQSSFSEVQFFVGGRSGSCARSQVSASSGQSRILALGA
jgi:hypothetical protein